MRATNPIRYVLPIAAILLFGSANPDPYPDDYFGSPLGIPLRLAGGFAEMRSNHFHSGLDIKTNGRPGYRVYSAADGWISRIAVSPSGFGHALYVSHPNGYMTVYAHLDRFEEPIRSFVEQLQYDRESFDVQYFPERNEFPVSKGDVIAYSGNSGSSSGPHLHFEVRDSGSGWPVHPLLFGFDVPDTIPPRIYRLKVYAGENGSSVRLHDRVSGGVRVLSEGESVLLDVNRRDGRHELDRVGLIEVTGDVAFGLQTHDYHEGSNSRLGAFKISLSADGRNIFTSRLERFSFSQTRYVNAHVDYEERASSGRWVQRGHVLPGNRLPVYESEQRGILSLAEGDSRVMRYDVEDIRGNRSRLEFQLRGRGEPGATDGGTGSSFILRHDQPFSMSRTGATLRIPEGGVYRDQPFQYRLQTTRPTGALADVHHIHRDSEPLHRAMTLTISVPTAVSAEPSSLSLAKVERGRLVYAGGEFENGAVTGDVREFGAYTVASDSEGPTLRMLNMSNGANMSRRRSIRVRIRDNFSGIDSYEGRIDGRWALFEYDAKYGLLTHSFDERTPPGRHELVLRATDNQGNETVQRVSFIR